MNAFTIVSLTRKTELKQQIAWRVQQKVVENGEFDKFIMSKAADGFAEHDACKTLQLLEFEWCYDIG